MSSSWWCWRPARPPLRGAWTGLSLESQQARGVQHIISRQVAAAELAVPGERFPAVQDAPVIHEQRLRVKRKARQKKGKHRSQGQDPPTRQGPELERPRDWKSKSGYATVGTTPAHRCQTAHETAARCFLRSSTAVLPEASSPALHDSQQSTETHSEPFLCFSAGEAGQ